MNAQQFLQGVSQCFDIQIVDFWEYLRNEGQLNDEDMFSPREVFESTDPRQLLLAVDRYDGMNGGKLTESEYKALFVHCFLYCLSGYKWHIHSLPSEEQITRLSQQGHCTTDYLNSTITYICTKRKTFAQIICAWEEFVEKLKREPSVKALETSGFFRYTERAFQLDFDVKHSNFNFEVDFLGGCWDRVFISLIKSLRDISTLNRCDFYELEEKRKRIVNDELSNEVSYVLFRRIVHLIHNLRPEHVDVLCQRYQFHHRYLDDEMASLMGSVEGIHEPLRTFARLVGWMDNVVAWSLEFLSSVETSDIANYRILSRTARFPLYAAVRRVSAAALADEWLELRFSKASDSQYDALSILLEKTYTCLSKIPPQPLIRIELNGEQESFGEEYELPVLKAFSPEDQTSWLKRFLASVKENPKEEVVTSSRDLSASSSATTVLGSSEEYPGPSPAERLASERENLRRNQTVANILKTNTKLSDDHMRRLTVPFVSVDIPADERITFFEEDGKTIIRETNLRKGGSYHCLCLTYDVRSEEWLIRPDWCWVRGLLPLDKSDKGANRETIVGDGSFLVSSETDAFVYKQHKSHIKHDNIHFYLGEIRAQCMARYLADRFHEATQDRFGCLRVLHADFIVVFQNSECETIIDSMIRERYMLSQSATSLDFHKFTNNSTWRNPDVLTDVYVAFSHFTFDLSEGVMMVVDLQGWVTLSCGPEEVLHHQLTDPVILIDCQPRALFGSSLINTGTRGMKNFFRVVHPTCNHICRELGLKRHPEYDI